MSINLTVENQYHEHVGSRNISISSTSLINATRLQHPAKLQIFSSQGRGKSSYNKRRVFQVIKKQTEWKGISWYFVAQCHLLQSILRNS